MKRSFLLLAGACLAAITSGAAVSQSEAEVRRIEELEKLCFKAREAKIREVQRQKIEECVKVPSTSREPAKSRQECERYWGDYGWVQGTVTGGSRPHLFADLPECERAFEARKKYRSG
jgi:hypothetical protein